MSAPSESLLPDEATENSTKFGFDDYSTLLASIIRGQSLQTPFTIAVHGDWGSGKTSLMKTIAKKLESPNVELVGVKAIWFSAWEFEKLPTPLWTVFLNRVIMDLQEMMPNADLKDKIKAVGKGVVLLSTDILLSRTLGVTSKDLEEIKDRIWEDIKRIDCLREELSKYIEEALRNDPEKRSRIAIFIDDLDRCLPEQCVEIFESIKLFLNCKNCVFIVGVDKEQIRQVFERKFGTKDESRGLNYVEKFVQLEFDLPRKTPEEVKDFLMEHASEQLQENPKTIELISRFIEPNPRKIKRWLNSVFFLERLFKIKQEKLSISVAEVDLSLASIWLFLKSFFPDFANLIESDPSVLNTAIKVVVGEGSDEDKQKIGDFRIDKRLSEFLSLLKPSYNENQLRDMVYLSRLTPVSHVSVLPKDILERIAEMTQDEFSDQLAMLNDENTLSLADRIIDGLSQIPDWQSYDKFAKLFDLLSLILERSERETLKIAMFDKIIEFALSSVYAYRYFCPKLGSYIAKPEIKKAIISSGLLDKIISIFTKSTSFDSAKENSALLIEFTESLTGKQLETIIEASFKNGQIASSWGAQKNLKKVFLKHKENISDEKIKEIKKNLDIEL